MVELKTAKTVQNIALSWRKRKSRLRDPLQMWVNEPGRVDAKNPRHTRHVQDDVEKLSRDSVVQFSAKKSNRLRTRARAICTPNGTAEYFAATLAIRSAHATITSPSPDLCSRSHLAACRVGTRVQF